MSKTEADNRILSNGLVRGAVNLDLHNGSVLWLSTDGEMLLCVSNLIYKMPSTRLAITPEVFFKSVGFTVDKRTALSIVSKLFSSVGYMEYSSFRNMVSVLDNTIRSSGGNIELVNYILKKL